MRIMDHLNEMAIFAKVVEAKSFSAAARHLNVTKSAVSKQVSRLEQALGVRLLNRTTRTLSLTGEGSAVYEHCARLVAAAEGAELAASQLTAVPRGTLRLSAPVSFGTRHIAPTIPAFLARYPETRVELVLLDRFVDLADEGFDLVIRLSERIPENLVARRLLDIDFVVCAAPAYLERHGTPRTPADLAAHNCLLYGHEGFGQYWSFRNTQAERVRVAGNFQVNSEQAVQTAVRAGVGLGLIPRLTVRDDLAQGVLHAVLTDWQALAPFSAVHAVYLPNRQLSPKVRALIDHLLEHFAAPPYLKG
jgi:DNA-binding transcriptional LysR family regulator